MKKSILIIVILILTSVIVNTGVGSSIFKYSNIDANDKNPNHVYLSEQEVYSTLNSEETKISKQNTSRRIEDSWDDIKHSYNIDDKEYLKLYRSDIDKTKLLNKYSIFKDSELCKSIDDIINQYRSNLQVGDLGVFVVKEQKIPIDIL